MTYGHKHLYDKKEIKRRMMRQDTFNYTLFGIVFFVTILICALVIPGLDMLAWHLLPPQGFWQKMILIAGEFISLWPRIVLDTFIFVGGTAFGNEISK
jgi:hypothetical protein